MLLSNIKICYFGIYNPNYSRNRVIIKGLGENGVEVLECRSDRKGIKKYFDLIKKHKIIKNKYDIMIVGFPGYQAMILAKILTRKKIIFDAFASIYDSMVNDRKVVKKYSVKAIYYFMLDWLSCKLADVILLDTYEQIKYFSEKFKINKNKFIRIFVGSDDEIIKPIKKDENGNYFLVHFHGSNIPLQGVNYIIEATKILENANIKFNIIGSEIKEKYKNIEHKNINFIDNIEYNKLGEFISKADISLGIFGDTEKARRVIPNKVYEALATKTAIITGKSPAINELLVDKENVLLCDMADSKDLADKILELKNNKELKNKIAENGYRLFKEKLTAKKIVWTFLKNITIKKI